MGKNYSKDPKRNTDISASWAYHKYTSYLPPLDSNPRHSSRSTLPAVLTYSAFLNFQAPGQHISALIPGMREVWLEGRVNVGKAIAIKNWETKVLSHRAILHCSCLQPSLHQTDSLPPSHPARPNVLLTDSSESSDRKLVSLDKEI